jgi:hypothetical protein
MGIFTVLLIVWCTVIFMYLAYKMYYTHNSNSSKNNIVPVAQANVTQTPVILDNIAFITPNNVAPAPVTQDNVALFGSVDPKIIEEPIIISQPEPIVQLNSQPTSIGMVPFPISTPFPIGTSNGVFNNQNGIIGQSV